MYLDCSWNVGRAHIIMFSTEAYFFPEYGFGSVKAQYEWLEKELAVSIINMSCTDKSRLINIMIELNIS